MYRAIGMLVSLLLVASTLWCAPARAEAPRLVCLVSAIKGPANISPADGPKKPLEVFTRLREGERLEVTRGAEVQLAFLQKGVRETWSGPATVLITADGGQSPDSASPPVTDKLPVRARPAGGEASSILTQAGEQATAQVKTREVTLPEDKPLSDEEKAQLAEIEAQVAQMRQAAGPADVGPDIVLLEELTRLQQRRKLGEELKRLRDAHPDNATLANWEVQ
ncbi:MAG: hypothetical protein AB9872_04695 [Solidesulfovibrio sp.]